MVMTEFIMMMITMILRMIADTVGEGAGRKIVVEKSTVPVKIQTYKKIPTKDTKTKHTTIICSWLSIRRIR